MPLVSFDRHQAVRLAKAIARSLAPGPDVTTSVVAICLALGGLLSLVLLPDFPDARAHYADGMLQNAGQSFSRWGISGKAVLGSSLLIAVTMSFVIDLRDIVAGKNLERLVYRDPTHNLSERAWSVILILLLGVVIRIWFFGWVSFLTLLNANMASVIWSAGPVVEFAMRPSDIAAVTFGVMSDPLDFWSVATLSGPWQVTTSLFVTGVTRFILLAFLIGVFGGVVAQLKETSSLSEGTLGS